MFIYENELLDLSPQLGICAAGLIEKRLATFL